MTRFAFFVFLGCDALFLLLGLTTLSISGDEAKLFFEGETLFASFLRLLAELFGQNDWTLRLPFIIIHLINLILIAKIAQTRLKRDSDIWFVVTLFAFLPGVNSAALLVSKAGFVMMGTLLFVLLYERRRTLSLLFLVVLTFVDNAFAFLFLGLIFYAMDRKDNILLGLCIALFGLSMTLFGFDMGGKPHSYFADTMALLATIFSPFVFLFFIYTLYRIAIKERHRDIFWYISTTAFMTALLFSFRQRIAVEDIAPLSVIAVPLMVRTFLSSYRSRLPQFRATQMMVTLLSLGVLTMTTLLSCFNKPLYYLLANPQDHFAYRFHGIHELADRLHQDGIDSVRCDDRSIMRRLHFYGIKEGGGVQLSLKPSQGAKKVSIFYNTIPIQTYYVTK